EGTLPIESSKEGRTTPLHGMETILVVEDAEMVRKLVCETLTAHGYHVIEASHAAEAQQLALSYNEPIHLLLADVIMPQMNGRELYQKLSALIPGIKVLYMSGYTDDVIAHHGILYEGVNFLQKPFTVHDLIQKIHKVLK
ncbi:MAG: response regulator, partial [Methanothrix sp.]|nr:response regulator [Methanothrix sp.]